MSFITEAAPEVMETPAELQHFIISKPLVCPCPDSHPPQDTVPHCGIKILMAYFYEQQLPKQVLPVRGILQNPHKIPERLLAPWLGSQRLQVQNHHSHTRGAGSAGSSPGTLGGLVPTALPGVPQPQGCHPHLTPRAPTATSVPLRRGHRRCRTSSRCR